MAAADPRDEFALSIDLESREASQLPEVELADIGIKERSDLQRWVEDHTEMVGPDLLLVTTEFDRWEIKQQKVADRLDVLFLDSDGHPLVAELKRGEATDTTELQALKYAAYCSTLTADELIEEYARYHNVSAEDARENVVEHAPALAEREPGAVRVRLLAGRFGPAVTSVVLWLNELGLDIGCIEIRVRKVSETQAVLVSRKILPPPEATDFLVRRRRREEAEEEKEGRAKRRNAVTVINERGSIEKGTELSLNLAAFNAEQRAAVEAKIAEDPRYGKVKWTGRGSRHSLEWQLDGGTYSPSGLVWSMLDDLGFDPGGVRGPLYWNLPDGRSINDEAEALLAAEGQPAGDGEALPEEPANSSTAVPATVPAASDGADEPPQETPDHPTTVGGTPTPQIR
ncbi:MAG TPA: hypothetical protein VF712_12550 [Thermoleophilaceae bacterium]|jgi:hypothetical protein